MVRKIAIVGNSPTRTQAPFEDSSWEIWGLNHLISYYPRIDLHFDVHDTSWVGTDNKYYDFIVSNKEKSLLTGTDKRFKECSIYPKDKIIEKYGDYFTCGISWMIAYAIEQNPTDIGVWGVDCNTNTEYVEQLGSILYLLGMVRGTGIQLHLPEECRLFRKKKLYWNN
jgi:hypothetical protein